MQIMQNVPFDKILPSISPLYYQLFIYIIYCGRALAQAGFTHCPQHSVFLHVETTERERVFTAFPG